MIAVLIHAHKNEVQLKMLINTLQHPGIKVFLHLDKKSGLKLNIPGVVIIEKPLSVEWGSFTQVKALLHSLEQISNSGEKFDFIHFISGQDFPIRPVNNFVNFLESKKGYSFIYYKKVENEWPEAAIRYSRLYFTENRIINFVLKFLFKYPLFFYRRKPPVTIYAGSQWVTISGEAMQYILENAGKGSALYRFFRYCDVSDEFFVQTALLNSPLKDYCINDHLRLIKWKAGTNSPALLTKNDFEGIKNSNAFFARKFDIAFDNEVIDRISNELL